MRLSHALIAAMCLIAPSGYGTALKYQANPNYLQYVSQNDAGDSLATRADTSLSVDHQPLGSETNKKTKGNQERPNKWLEPIVLVTAAYVIVSFLMLRAINKQGEQNERQIAVASNLGKWTAEQADYTRRQWCATHEQDLTMTEQLAEMGRLTRETKVAAEAAKRSADALVEIERPWVQVLIPRIDIPHPPYLAAQPFVYIWPHIGSVGKTPVRLKYAVFASRVIPKDNNLPYPTPPALPEPPDYSGGRSVDKEWQITPGTGVMPAPVEVSIQEWESVQKRDKFLYVYGWVEYGGVGGDDYSTGFCNLYWVPYGHSDPQPEGFMWSFNIPDSYIWNTWAR